jgi:hypothetical protein
MFKIALVALLFAALIGCLQAQPSIQVIDFVKIINGKQREAMFFYENNWKVYREIAKEKGFIKSWQLLAAPADTITNFDIMLITEYADSVPAGSASLISIKQESILLAEQTWVSDTFTQVFPCTKN